MHKRHTQTLALGFHLGVRTDGLFALCAGVGAQLVEALDAHVLVVLLHVFLAVQVVAAVEAVGAVSHGGGEVTPGTWGATRECVRQRHLLLAQPSVPFRHQRGTVLLYLRSPSLAEQCR